MSLKKEDLNIGSHTLLFTCGQLKDSEKALIISDNKTKDVGEAILSYGREKGSNLKLVTIEALNIHGAEPPGEIAKEMLEYDLILGLTSFSMAHTQARKASSQKGARYLSLPDYDLGILASKALQADYQAQVETANKLEEILSLGEKVTLTTNLGTNLELKISSRECNNCVGILSKPGTLSSPPDMEVNIAPLEEHSNGKVVIDGSIPHPTIGLLSSPVTLEVNNGKITEFKSEDSKVLEKLDKLFSPFNDNARVLAEFGIGLNPMAVLCGRMLEDEGCMGTVHFGFGSNATIGGNNSVAFHLDFIMRDATVVIDDRTIIEEGNILKNV